MSYDAVSHGGTGGGEGGEACIKYVSMGSVTSSETRPRKDCKLEKKMKQLCVVKCSICTEVQIPPLKTFLIGTGRLGGRILVVSPYTLSATTDSPQLSPP